MIRTSVSASLRIVVLAIFASTAPVVLVACGSNRSALTSGSVSGHLTVLGSSAPHEPLTGTLEFTDSGGAKTVVTSLPDGSYRARLRPGSYRVLVSAPESTSHGGPYVCPGYPITIVVKTDTTTIRNFSCLPPGS